MLKKVMLVVAAAIGVFLIYVAMQPSEFMVARETVIAASPEAIFPHVNNSRKANDWMPWKDSDPGAVMQYSGPDEGVGSTSSWDSSGKMGKGQAVVAESIPGKSVKTQLTYWKPMEMSQVAEISLSPAASGTTVRWTVSGRNSFVGRIFCTFMNMDKMVGGEFEKGLARLKQTVESRS